MFVVIFIMIFIAGAIIRFSAEGKLLFSNLTYIKKSISTKEYQGESSPLSVVIDFYRYIDSGQYDKAWEISFEPKWYKNLKGNVFLQQIDANCNSFSGFISENEFVERSYSEIGPAGSWISIQNISAELIQGTPVKIRDCIRESIGYDKVYYVLVRGHILGACGVYEWRKYLAVIEKNGEYKVLLPGDKKRKSFYYQSWFSNMKKVSYLRAGEK